MVSHFIGGNTSKNAELVEILNQQDNADEQELVEMQELENQQDDVDEQQSEEKEN